MAEDANCLSFYSTKGIKIFYRREIPQGARGIVIISHGYGEHAGFYQEFSGFLRMNGYGVYAYDHRAHGHSEEERGHIEQFECFTDDLAEVVKHSRQENPALPLFIFGHSMGGLIAFTYGILHPRDIQGQIFTGSAVGSPWGVNLIPEWLFALGQHFFARARIYPVISRRGSRNKEYSASYRGDPLILRYATLGFFYEFVQRGIPWAQQNAWQYQLPCLILHGKADKIIPYRSSLKIYDQIASKDKKLKVYTGLYHELVQEPEREQVWQDILMWLNERTKD